MRSVFFISGIKYLLGSLLILLLFGCNGDSNDDDQSNRAPSAVISNPVISGIYGLTAKNTPGYEHPPKACDDH